MIAEFDPGPGAGLILGPAVLTILTVSTFVLLRLAGAATRVFVDRLTGRNYQLEQLNDAAMDGRLFSSCHVDIAEGDE